MTEVTYPYIPDDVEAAPRRRRDPASTHDAILAAARALMAERGPEGLTVSEVAHRASVNRTTAYQHFRTRDDVVAAVVKAVSNEVSGLLEADLSLGERIDHMVGWHLENPDIARLWLFQLLSDVPLPRDESWESFLRGMKALAASGRTREDIDPEMLAHVLLGATLVWSLLARRGPRGEAGAKAATERFTRELKRLLLYGVLKPDEWPDVAAAVARPASARRTQESAR